MVGNRKHDAFVLCTFGVREIPRTIGTRGRIGQQSWRISRMPSIFYVSQELLNHLTCRQIISSVWISWQNHSNTIFKLISNQSINYGCSANEIPWKWWLGHWTVKILTQRLPPICYIESEDIVVAFLYYFIIPVFDKSRKIYVCCIVLISNRNQLGCCVLL